ncbi:hypothetical protein IV505_00600 [Pseudomonas fulva]|nr:hypothetical protein [Pseudomonas fulva]MBF8778228.1 hypothetical protein [Pseudomonas fulva]
MNVIELGATTRGALEQLLLAASADGAQARAVAEFLKAWWNPDVYGGFALDGLAVMDDENARACVLVFAWIAANRLHPLALGYGPRFEVLFGSTAQGASPADTVGAACE